MGDRAFGMWLGHEGRDLPNGINALVEKTSESSLVPSPVWGYKKSAVWNLQVSLHQNPPCYTPISDLQSEELWEIKFLLFVNHTVYGILLSQPEATVAKATYVTSRVASEPSSLESQPRALALLQGAHQPWFTASYRCTDACVHLRSVSAYSVAPKPGYPRSWGLRKDLSWLVSLPVETAVTVRITIRCSRVLFHQMLKSISSDAQGFYYKKVEVLSLSAFFTCFC